MPTTNKETENTNPKVEEKVTTKDEAIAENTEGQEETKNGNNFLRKILIYIIAFLISLLVIIFIFYIFDFFVSDNKEKETQVVMETPIATQPQIEKEEPKQEEYSFDFNNLDTDKLNEQLALLTNKNIEQSRLEKLRAENEKKLLEQNKINKPLIKDNQTVNEVAKNENIVTNEVQKTAVAEQNNTTTIKSDTTTTQTVVKQENTKEETQVLTSSSNNNFIKLINVAKIKGELKKKFLDKAVNINPNIHLCRDSENIIELYFGPFENDEMRKELFNKLVSKGFKEAYELEMTQEEFDRSCNY